jgi:hypothetical protein
MCQLSSEVRVTNLTVLENVQHFIVQIRALLTPMMKKGLKDASHVAWQWHVKGEAIGLTVFCSGKTTEVINCSSLKLSE